MLFENSFVPLFRALMLRLSEFLNEFTCQQGFAGQGVSLASND
ncbi:hypothetical protein [Rhizobium leguminosarum]|nr:hypothetical protein [Rhizobium leguminosarum]